MRFLGDVPAVIVTVQLIHPIAHDNKAKAVARAGGIHWRWLLAGSISIRQSAIPAEIRRDA